MAKKRRTKKQKLTAKHEFGYVWNSANSRSLEAVVNRQTKKPKEVASNHNTNLKTADITAKGHESTAIMRDVAKSILLSSLIIALEIVLYLIWKKPN